MSKSIATGLVIKSKVVVKLTSYLCLKSAEEMTHSSNRISQFGSNIAGVLTLNTHSPKGVGVCKTPRHPLLPEPLMYHHEILDRPKRMPATKTYLPLENLRSACLLCCCPGLLWNSLPVYVETSEIVQIFKRRTKTFLFIQAFFVTRFFLNFWI